MAPIMAMEGHQGEIFTVQFQPDGQYLASSGYDRMICEYSNILNPSKCLLRFLLFNLCLTVLWKVYGECENVGMMTGHTGAVMEMHFSTDGAYLFTASTDQSCGVWDVEAGVRIKKLKGKKKL